MAKPKKCFGGQAFLGVFPFLGKTIGKESGTILQVPPQNVDVLSYLKHSAVPFFFEQDCFGNLLAVIRPCVCVRVCLTSHLITDVTH